MNQLIHKTPLKYFSKMKDTIMTKRRDLSTLLENLTKFEDVNETPHKSRGRPPNKIYYGENKRIEKAHIHVATNFHSRLKLDDNKGQYYLYLFYICNGSLYKPGWYYKCGICNENRNTTPKRAVEWLGQFKRQDIKIAYYFPILVVDNFVNNIELKTFENKIRQSLEASIKREAFDIYSLSDTIINIYSELKSYNHLNLHLHDYKIFSIPINEFFGLPKLESRRIPTYEYSIKDIPYYFPRESIDITQSNYFDYLSYEDIIMAQQSDKLFELPNYFTRESIDITQSYDFDYLSDEDIIMEQQSDKQSDKLFELHNYFTRESIDITQSCDVEYSSDEDIIMEQQSDKHFDKLFELPKYLPRELIDISQSNYFDYLSDEDIIMDYPNNTCGYE